MVYKLTCRYAFCTCGSQAQTHAFHLPFLYSCGSLIQVAVRWLCCGHCAWFACILQLLLLSFYHRFQWLTASRDTCVRLQIRLQKEKKKKKSSKPRGHNSASTMCSAPACVRCDPPDSAPGGTDLTYSGHLRDPLLFFNAASHFSTLNINWKSPSSAWMLFSEIVVTSW